MALSHAILVTLLDRPHSGYEISKRFDQTVGFFWRARKQQIYQELHKLAGDRSEEHTSELQSLMRISYAVFCLKKKKRRHTHTHTRDLLCHNTNTTHN